MGERGGQKSPPRTQKNRDRRGPGKRQAAQATARKKVSLAPPPLLCPPGARPCPASPAAQCASGPVRRSTVQWLAPGPPPRVLIGRRRASLALLTSSLGSCGPTRSRRVRPGTRPALGRQRGTRPRAPELAFWGVAGGARARARPARAPGAPKGRPRSQPARSPCPAAGPCCGWKGGPALHGPGC